MLPNDYQREAARTEASQGKALDRLMNVKVSNLPEENGHKSGQATRLLHGCIGVINELGEITSTIQKRYWYGKPITDDEMRAKIKDEAGDVCWHLMQVLSAFGVTFDEVLVANIAKLKARYPDAGWSAEACENRDRVKESLVQSITKEYELKPGEITGVTFDLKTLMPQEAADKINHLQGFKDYVHKRLDDAGVPTFEEESKDGSCRIEKRLGWVFNKAPGASPLPNPWDTH